MGYPLLETPKVRIAYEYSDQKHTLILVSSVVLLLSDILVRINEDPGCAEELISMYIDKLNYESE
jgi:hypothetical protein